MKIEQLLTALAGRGVTQAALRAGNKMQLQVNGQWQAQNATMTDETLSAMIEEALEPAARAAWDAPEGRASFERQGFSVAARKTGGAVQILIKQSAIESSTAQNSASTPVHAVAQAPTQSQGLAPAPSPDWFYIEGESEKGPFPPQKMQLMVSMGSLAAHTLVWRAGMETWTAIQNTELAAYLPIAEVMPPIASPTGGGFVPRPRGGIGGNDSGTGESAMVPPEVGNWNWGAFFLPLFWGHAHNQGGRAWAIFLTNLIPLVGGFISLALTIMMASQGNSLAWKHRRWDSVEHLKKTERVWFFWGMGVLALSVIGGLAYVLLD